MMQDSAISKIKPEFSATSFLNSPLKKTFIGCPTIFRIIEKKLKATRVYIFD